MNYANNMLKKALMIAANGLIALEGTPEESYEEYLKLKEMAKENPDMRMDDLDDLGGAWEGDANTMIHEMVSEIEFNAKNLVDFAKEALNAAHQGLIEAAIDGSLDSDANAWSLEDYARQHM